MLKILNLVLDICLLRAGPQDVPASRSLLQLMVLSNLVLSVAGLLPEYAFGPALGQVLVDVLIFGAMIFAALQWRGLPGRFLQTFTAAMGCDALFALVLLPIALSVGNIPEGQASLAAAVAGLALVVWYVVVVSHILRHALSVPFALALLFALVYIGISWNVNGLIFGRPG